MAGDEQREDGEAGKKTMEVWAMNDMYIGDGVYVETTEHGHICLTTDKGDQSDLSKTIILRYKTWQNLLNWVQELNEPRAERDWSKNWIQSPITPESLRSSERY